MTRKAWIALAGATAIATAAPLAAQEAAQGAAGQATAAQPATQPAASAPAADATNTDEPAVQPKDGKAKAKAKDDTSGATVVRAGPNAGQVIGGKKKPKADADAAPKPAGDASSTDSCTADHPCK